MTGCQYIVTYASCGCHEPVGKSSVTGGVEKPSVSLVIQVVDTSGPGFWIRVVGAAVCDDSNGGDHPCDFPTTDHGEAGETKILRVMGDTVGREGARGGGDAVGGHKHWPSTGDGSIVGGPTTTLGGLRSAHGKPAMRG